MEGTTEDKSDKGPSPQKLEGTSEELQLLRKQLLVEGLLKNGAGADKSKRGHGHGQGPLKGTIKMGPSSVLNKVKEFLPVFQVENEKLFRKVEENPASVSIEADPSEDKGSENADEPLVEMNIALVERDDSSSDSESDKEEDDHKNDEDNASGNAVLKKLIEEIKVQDQDDNQS